MNDISGEKGLSIHSETEPQSVGLWGKTVAFLNRDVKSFLPGGSEGGENQKQIMGGIEEVCTNATVNPTFESLVDANKLSDMVFRREVLDWRDNFQANITIALGRLNRSFAAHVSNEIGNTSIFRKLITRPTDQVLQVDFERIVRMPLITELKNEEVKLNVCAQKWGLFGKYELTFNIHRLNAECLNLHDLGFKPSNKDLITSRICNLIIGPSGLAVYYQDQAQHLARKLMEAKDL